MKSLQVLQTLGAERADSSARRAPGAAVSSSGDGLTGPAGQLVGAWAIRNRPPLREPTAFGDTSKRADKTHLDGDVTNLRKNS